MNNVDNNDDEVAVAMAMVVCACMMAATATAFAAVTKLMGYGGYLSSRQREGYMGYYDYRAAKQAGLPQRQHPRM